MTDCSKKINHARKEIQRIVYQCNTTVAQEDDWIVPLKCPALEEGNIKGPVHKVDIIEDCQVVCRVEVLGRKIPLKVHLDFDEAKKDAYSNPSSTKNDKTKPHGGRFTFGHRPKKKQLKNLRVYASNESNCPDEITAKQMFLNP